MELRRTRASLLGLSLLASGALLGSACSEPTPPPTRTPPPVRADGTAAYVTESPKAPTSAAPRPAPAPAAAAQTVPEGERLFNRSGCVGCHGPRMPFSNHLVIARSKPPAEVARWIRNAKDIKPDTMMPNYEASLSEADALALAKWIIAGNPKPAQ